jgi:hypothetical protein
MRFDGGRSLQVLGVVEADRAIEVGAAVAPSFSWRPWSRPARWPGPVRPTEDHGGAPPRRRASDHPTSTSADDHDDGPPDDHDRSSDDDHRPGQGHGRKGKGAGSG